MAKCIGSVDIWNPTIVELENPEFIVNDVRAGESLLCARLESMSPLLLDIANDYIQIKQSALCDELKVDCSQVQDSLMAKLEQLQFNVNSVIQSISKAQNLPTSTRHRYFIAFSYGVVEKLRQLLQTVGRLSDLDHRLYSQEGRKLLISEESIAIHSLTSIWTAIIKVLECLCTTARPIFNTDHDKQQEPEYDFIGQLEFSTFHLLCSKILLMDLIITSWIKFNRLSKFDDIVESLPSLCPCQWRIHLRILRAASQDCQNSNILNEFLPLIYDHQSKPSMMTLSLRCAGIVPLDPCFVGSNPINIAYFVIWYLYSLSRLVTNDFRSILSRCKDILESSLDVAFGFFLPTSDQKITDEASYRLSPNQKERFELIFLMINSWCERNNAQDNSSLLAKLFLFMDNNWNLLGVKYFNCSELTVNGLTLFQLFTKLFNEAIPIYSLNVQSVQKDNQVRTKEENALIEAWNRLLNRIQPPKQPINAEISKS